MSSHGFVLYILSEYCRGLNRGNDWTAQHKTLQIKTCEKLHRFLASLCTFKSINALKVCLSKIIWTTQDAQQSETA